MINKNMKTFVTLILASILLVGCAVPKNPKISWGKKCAVQGQQASGTSGEESYFISAATVMGGGGNQGSGSSGGSGGGSGSGADAGAELVRGPTRPVIAVRQYTALQPSSRRQRDRQRRHP